MRSSRSQRRASRSRSTRRSTRRTGPASSIATSSRRTCCSPQAGRVKVADFGIARAFTEAQLTMPGTTLGSVHYFSPEQARGEMVTTASDVYSAGLVLFEMLTGQARMDRRLGRRRGGRAPRRRSARAVVAAARRAADPRHRRAARAGAGAGRPAHRGRDGLAAGPLHRRSGRGYGSAAAFSDAAAATGAARPRRCAAARRAQTASLRRRRRPPYGAAN